MKSSTRPINGVKCVQTPALEKGGEQDRNSAVVPLKGEGVAGGWLPVMPANVTVFHYRVGQGREIGNRVRTDLWDRIENSVGF